ncbi:MAG: hypothetical protein EKK62_03945 [Acidimicrobiia bacterium]|nr:MAG: hypothetical protein EKK62_03945 [Acidimicrobiia bacterium]
MTIKLDLDSPSDDIAFDGVVRIPTPDGAELLVPFVFRYRDREETAALFDEFIARDRARAAQRERAAAEASGAQPQEPDEKTLRQYAIEATERDVEATLKIAKGWGVEGREFGAEQLAKFFRRFPGAYGAIVTHWRLSLTEGRLGN